MGYIMGYFGIDSSIVKPHFIVLIIVLFSIEIENLDKDDDRIVHIDEHFTNDDKIENNNNKHNKHNINILKIKSIRPGNHNSNYMNLIGGADVDVIDSGDKDKDNVISSGIDETKPNVSPYEPVERLKSSKPIEQLKSSKPEEQPEKTLA